MILEARGWNMSQVARKLGTSPSTLSTMLNGDRAMQTTSIDRILDLVGADDYDLADARAEIDGKPPRGAVRTGELRAALEKARAKLHELEAILAQADAAASGRPQG